MDTLSTDLPEPRSYKGRHFLTLPFPADVFADTVRADVDWALLLDRPTDRVTISLPPGTDPTGHHLDEFTVRLTFKPGSSPASAILFQSDMLVPEAGASPPESNIWVQLGGHELQVAHVDHDFRTRALRFGRPTEKVWWTLELVQQPSSSQVLVRLGRADGSSVPPEHERTLDMSGGLNITDRTMIGGQLAGDEGDGSGASRGDLQVDDFQIWSRALTSAELDRLRADPWGVAPDGDLLVDYRMDAGRGGRLVNRADPGFLRRGEGGSPSVASSFDGIVDGADWVRSTARAGITASEGTGSVARAVRNAIAVGEFDPGVFVGGLWQETDETRHRVREHLASLDEESFVRSIGGTHRVEFFFSTTGSVEHRLLPFSIGAEPQLALIETYRVSVYRGRYGPGKIINTTSLLPGEATELSISTYASSSSSSSKSESILDSVTSTAVSSFATAVEKESETSSAEQSSSRWSADVAGGASGGVGVAWNVSAELSAGGDSSTSRSSLAKSVASATSEQGATASAQRDIQVNTVTEVSSIANEESAIVRRIENINLSRTLNFVFRQMNQEYLSVLHLVDLDVGFRIPGDPTSTRVVPLPELERLLEDVVRPDDRDAVRARVLSAIGEIRDVNQLPPGDFVEHVPESTGSDGTPRRPYHRVNARHVEELYADGTPTGISVPGVITDVTSTIMRTDHVYADSFLGLGDALDAYSRGLQDQSVMRGELENDRLRSEVAERRQRLLIRKAGLAALRDGDKVRARLYADLFGDPDSVDASSQPDQA